MPAETRTSQKLSSAHLDSMTSSDTFKALLLTSVQTPSLLSGIYSRGISLKLLSSSFRTMTCFSLTTSPC
ncbi:unnamed protein product [Dibothriocephalus latus]|uniref:Uncharacterized protein n=1 Tax=Dibothriocephalus latus TaxID=60516 RepID=A0A3P7QM10_DIBLA|nr:unnamed protein product [Dibothriocephalus latus]